ncbi:hypothetical protein GDO81_028273 [Engystomops pustulosus]|uniref:Uncharacterized protein n=1 Tax=Engystomops pustulosus TaxID=76066 RepID=A0AAV6ZDA1_ENGPU|nr:hypothetical protein GDO81_028273 [Engystomops pustulosus]
MYVHSDGTSKQNTLDYFSLDWRHMISAARCDWLLVLLAVDVGKMEGSVGRLEEEALKRKERLRELRKKRLREDGGTDGDGAGDEEEEKHRSITVVPPSARSYKRQDESAGSMVDCL